MTYKIEKNIKIPGKMIHGVETHKYPFFDMKVGDSFAVPVDPSTELGYQRVRRRISTAIAAQHKRPVNGEARFSYRSIKDKRELRVWRIK